MLFEGKVAVYGVKQAKPLMKKVALLTVEVTGTYSYHCALQS
jgi:plastocyanin